MGAQLMVVETWVLKALAPVFQSSLASRLAPEQHGTTLMCFEGIGELRAGLGIDNRLFGYAVLVDASGRVRWSTRGAPHNASLGAAFVCTRAVLRESDAQPTN